MTKRQKKYNPTKHRKALANQLLRNLVIAFTTGEDYCYLLNRKTLQVLSVSSVEYKLLTSLPYKWSIYVAGLGRNEKSTWIMGDLIQASNEYYQSDLIPQLEEHHLKVIQRVNPNAFIGAAWVASPMGHDFSEAEAYEIFNSIGAFDRERDNETNEVFVTSKSCPILLTQQTSPNNLSKTQLSRISETKVENFTQ